MRVLIVKTSPLGDIVQALPVLDYLHQVSPGIEVDWAIEERYCDLLAANPLVAKLHPLRTREWRKHPLAARTRREMSAFRGALRERRYDRVFDIQGDLTSGLVSWLTGADDRLGFGEDDVQDRVNLFFTTRQVPLKRLEAHVTDQCLRLVSVPFARDYRSMTLHGVIPVAPEDDLTASALLSTLGDGLVFLFQSGSSRRTRLWSDLRWEELGRALLARFPDATILLAWGTPAERDLVKGLAERIGSGARVIDRYPLKGLAALLKKVDLVVGGDTGPVQMAAAVGTPTVSLHRATDGRRCGPRGPLHAVVQAPLECSGCYRTTCSRDRECRESISADMVLRGIEQILGKGEANEIPAD